MGKRFAILLVSSCLFADGQNPPWPDYGLPDCFPAGYNAPGGVELACGWDFFTTGSFIYWHANQDYMDAARSAAFLSSGAVPVDEAVTEYPDFDYKPGFKIGVGLESGLDNWYILSEYTWLHQSTRHLSNPVPATLTPGDRVWIPNDWFNTLSIAAQPQAAAIHTHWKFHLDMLDMTMCRPFYEGQHFTVQPSVGLRSLWIRQMYRIDAFDALNLSSPPATSFNLSQCWSIGPTAGADSHWLLPYGIHIKGSLGFSLLYTRYTKLSHSETDSTFSSAAAAPIHGTLNHYGCLRSITEMGAGIGWGSYFFCQRIHLSFSAEYDFALFWAQNMLRQTVASLQDNPVGYVDPAGDLHIHGLTVNARLDF